jgi:hypothetical protein
MAAYGFYLTAGDLLPVCSVKAYSNGVAQTLTGISSVTFKMWPQGLNNNAANLTVNATGTSSTDTDGTTILTYSWQSGDTAAAGVYWCEFEVTFTSGKVESFPTPGQTFGILVSVDR